MKHETFEELGKIPLNSDSQRDLAAKLRIQGALMNLSSDNEEGQLAWLVKYATPFGNLYKKDYFYNLVKDVNNCTDETKPARLIRLQESLDNEIADDPLLLEQNYYTIN